MKRMNIITTLILASLFWACEKPDAPLPKVEQDTVFELIWATRMDFEKEIVGTDNTQHYKDWLLVGGDLGFPPTIMAFNKDNGEKDWELILHQVDGKNIHNMILYNNILLAKNGYSVFAINLDTKELLWEENLKVIGMRLGRISLASNGKLYLNADFAFGTSGQVLHIYEFDPYSGENRTVYGAALDSTGVYSCSPPAIWFDEELNKDLLVFNLYPDAFGPPQDGAQYLIGVEPDTKQELWRIPIVDQFSSGGGHPPVIIDNHAITGGWDMIFSIDLLTKSIAWDTKFDYSTAVWGKTQRLVIDGKVYANSGQEDVACLDLETGDFIWRNPSGGPNCTDNMLYYEKEDLLVFTSWGYGSVMILDAFTGETIHKEHNYDNSQYTTDVVYDKDRDMFFTNTYKHAIGFKVHKPK